MGELNERADHALDAQRGEGVKVNPDGQMV
jgi:hypothetical protein